VRVVSAHRCAAACGNGAYLVAEAAHARSIWLLLNLESVVRKQVVSTGP